MAGGVLNMHRYEIEMECLVSDIPESLEVSINSLEIGDSVTLGDLEIPSGAIIDLDPSEVILEVNEPTVVEDETEDEAADATVEPEVIGKKAEEDEGDES